ncbi:MAG TPA: hypothetical protein VK761_01105, partial [Solirubrobacteraceae bacterium]|nr:hypothetical protein [Solirubrobacteraceae bacterium]
TLPQGKYSALGANVPGKANYSFCSQKLSMPTEMIAQNGAVLKQSTPVAATGCPKAKAAKRGKSAKRAKSAGRGGKGLAARKKR